MEVENDSNDENGNLSEGTPTETLTHNDNSETTAMQEIEETLGISQPRKTKSKKRSLKKKTNRTNAQSNAKNRKTGKEEEDENEDDVVRSDVETTPEKNNNTPKKKRGKEEMDLEENDVNEREKTTKKKKKRKKTTNKENLVSLDGTESNGEADDTSDLPEEKKTLQLKEDGTIDVNSVTLYDLIKLGNNYGKPSKWLLEKERKEREEAEKEGTAKQRKRKSTKGGSPSVSIPSTPSNNQNESIETVTPLDEPEVRSVPTKRTTLLGPSVRSTAVTNSFAPRLTVVNGKIVMEEESLTEVANEAMEFNREDYTTVFETGNYVNSNSYTNRVKSEKWSQAETEKFYDILKQFGSNFEMMAKMFPGRDRRQIKMKFKREEKSSPARIEEALKTRTPIDMDEWKKVTEENEDSLADLEEDATNVLLNETNQSQMEQPEDSQSRLRVTVPQIPQMPEKSTAQSTFPQEVEEEDSSEYQIVYE